MAGSSNALRKALVLELKAERIVPRIGQLFEPGGHPEDKQHRCIDPHRNPGVALFEFPQGGARNKGPPRHKRGGDTAPQTGGANIAAQLGERPFHG